MIHDNVKIKFNVTVDVRRDIIVTQCQCVIHDIILVLEHERHVFHVGILCNKQKLVVWIV